MKNFLACLKKDILLFFSRGRGIAVVILLPLIMLFTLRLGLQEVSEVRNYIKPFSIVVTDLDQTSMSKMLVDQIENVEVFDNVELRYQKSNDAAFEEGVACEITIPKDYFYDMFTMDGVIDIRFNSKMPAESELCESFLLQIVDVFRAAQESYCAEYSLRFGDSVSITDNAEWMKLISERIIANVFDLIASMNQKEYLESLSVQTKAMMSSCVIFLVAFLVPLYTLKSFSDDLDSGMLTRYRSAGGSVTAQILAKFFTALLIFSIVAVPFCFALFEGNVLPPLGSSLLLFVTCFSILAPFSLCIKRSSTFMLLSNTYLILSVIMSGCIYPLQLYPNWAQAFARFFAPNYLIGSFATKTGGPTVELVTIAVVTALIGCLASAALLLVRRWKHVKH